MIKNRMTATIFRGVAMVFALGCVMRQVGVFSGHVNFSIMMYYTIQSNILAGVMFAILFFRTLKGLRAEGAKGSASYLARFEMVCVIDLFLTFFVYWVMLVPQSFSMDGDMGLWTFDNLAVHLLTPLLCLVDYFLFTKPGHLKYKDCFAVLIYPLSYVLVTSIMGFCGYDYGYFGANGQPVRFPYFFLDFDQLGLMVFAYVAALVAFFLILSHIIYFIDKKRAKPDRN